MKKPPNWIFGPTRRSQVRIKQPQSSINCLVPREGSENILSFVVENLSLSVDGVQHRPGHGLLLDFSWVEGDWSDPAAAFLTVLNDICVPYKATCKKDCIHFSREDTGHLTNGLCCLV